MRYKSLVAIAISIFITSLIVLNLQSHPQTLSTRFQNPSSKRIAFINGHHGTSADFKHLSKLLKFNFAEFNARMLFDGEYTITIEKTRKLISYNLGKFFCDAFDIVAVGDINPDGQFLMKHMMSNPSCNIKLIMITTNRFDFGLNGNDAQEYYNLVRNSLNDDRFSYVSNNPWFLVN